MAELDAIMVVKGFQIDNICNQHNVPLIEPPFLKGKKQFSKSKAFLSRDIANARIYIERINQRIKTFNILQTKFPYAHVNLANDIIYITCGICNLNEPIFVNDKFNIT